jgi:alpha-ketoglutarate-dependent taurine dioxygenase
VIHDQGQIAHIYILTDTHAPQARTNHAAKLAAPSGGWLHRRKRPQPARPEMAAAAVPGDDDAPWDFEIFERGTLAEAKERLASAVADGVLAVTPQTAHCGAELAGLRLQQPLSAREVEAVRDALLIHKVVFFREQLLDHDQHEEFASRFGPLTIGHISLGHVPSHPSIFALKATGRVPRDPTKPRRPRPLGNPLAGWHTDITAALNPPAISVLRAEAIPSVGGDTCWSNMAAAHAALSPPMQAFAEGLRAVHYPATTWPGPHARGRPSEARPGEQAIDMVTEHPLVTVHPETQERVLNCSPSFLKRIQDLSPRESETVLAMLWEHATRPEFVFRHRWSVGDVVMWDNRGGF